MLGVDIEREDVVAVEKELIVADTDVTEPEFAVAVAVLRLYSQLRGASLVEFFRYHLRKGGQELLY